MRAPRQLTPVHAVLFGSPYYVPDALLSSAPCTLISLSVLNPAANTVHTPWGARHVSDRRCLTMTCWGVCIQAPPSHMLNNVTFIPTSQALAPLRATNPPSQTDRAASPKHSPPLQRASPPPSIQQAAAATAAANRSPVRCFIHWYDDSHRPRPRAFSHCSHCCKSLHVHQYPLLSLAINSVSMSTWLSIVIMYLLLTLLPVSASMFRLHVPV